MARKSRCTMTFLLLCVVAAAALIAVANAQTTNIICNVKISELAECLPAISGETPKDPSRACCAAMHKANLRCMCKLKPQLSKYGLSPTKAMKLPATCGLKLPAGC